MKKTFSKFLLIGLCLLISLSATAQKNKSFVREMNIDFVSTYVWRGQAISGPAIQPSVDMGVGNLNLNVWGSSTLKDGSFREVVNTLSYEIKGLSLGVTHYWNDYDFDKFSRDYHMFEAGVGYTFAKFPLKLEWNTVIGYSGGHKQNEKDVYSSYFKASYAFEKNDWLYDFGVGVAPWESAWNDNDSKDVQVTEMSAQVGKMFNVSSKVRLAAFSNLVYNPYRDRLYFVMGLSFKM